MSWYVFGCIGLAVIFFEVLATWGDEGPRENDSYFGEDDDDK